MIGLLLLIVMSLKMKGKAIPLRGRGGPSGYETSRLPHFAGRPLSTERFLVLISVRD
jgi:hypothetical protein